MASAGAPRKRTRSVRRLILIVGGILVILAACAGGVYFFMPKAPAAGTLPDGWQTVEASSGAINSTVSATGNIEAAAEADLSFEQSGTLTEILVKSGDTVQAGQPLARIDTSGLQLQVDQAQAELSQAQADYEQLLAGASATDLDEAQARLAQARSQYSQTASSVSNADIAAARADLEQAQARLARLESGPASDELAAANEQVQRARASLDQSRIDLAAAKERARIDVETRANALRNAQDEYSRIYWENRELEKLPGDLPQTNKDNETAAQRAVKDAETALEAARVAYEQARQDEVNTLATNEAALSSAIASRDKTVAGPKAEELADARAAVERAQASLDQLTGANRASELAAGRANVEIAQAGLDALRADPTKADLATREAALVRAEVSLKSAQRDLDLATLKAPFPATIGKIDMQVGEAADPTAIMSVVDLSGFHVDVPVDELDVAQIMIGQRANISLDALPSSDFSGTVTNIAPQATRNEQGTTTYDVTVQLDGNTGGIKPGMTAVVEIITSEKTGAVLVPRRAIRTEGGKSYVLIFDPTGQPRPVANGGAVGFEPASQRRDVTIGLSNSEFVEVVSGLQPGETVLVQDVVSTFNPAGQ